MENPFFSAVQAGCPVNEIVRIAIAVKVAHNDSAEVWASLRTLDNIVGVAGGYHASYLNGRSFQKWVDESDGNIQELRTLRDFAHTFYDIVGRDVVGNARKVV